MNFIEEQFLLQAYRGLGVMLAIGICASALVFVAMCADFISGWRKAKERGEVRNSHRASRSINKFLLYEGAMIICICADTLIHFVWSMFSSSVYFVPIACCVVGVILCCVEVLSIREKADDKTRRNLDVSAKIIAQTLEPDVLKEIIASAIKQEKDNDNK